MVIIVAEFKKSPQSGEKNRAKRENFLKSRREASKIFSALDGNRSLDLWIPDGVLNYSASRTEVTRLSILDYLYPFFKCSDNCSKCRVTTLHDIIMIHHDRRTDDQLDDVPSRHKPQCSHTSSLGSKDHQRCMLDVGLGHGRTGCGTVLPSGLLNR